jgi:hypothetical protein
MTETDPNVENSTKIPDIFLKIWTSPKKIFKFIDDYKYDNHVVLLLVLSGIARTFDRAATKNMGDTFSLWGVILFCIIVGGLFGWISYYVYAALISWTGKWFNGRSDTQGILRVMAYALFPSILALVLLLPQIAIYGNGIFQSSGDVTSAGTFENVFFYSSLLLEFGLSVWTIVLCIIGVSVVQKFSIGKTILNLFLPAILFVSIVFILFLITRLFI